MNCPDCGRSMNESMDKKHEYFTCPRCGFEVHRSSWDAMDRYWLKEKCLKYTNLITWQKLKELKKGKDKTDCNNCGRPINGFTEKRHQHSTCPKSRALDAMDRYWAIEEGMKKSKTKIGRMGYDGAIIRNENMAIVNHNKSVDKINEMIDVLNELTAPVTAKAEEEKTLLIDENLHVIEFCCDEVERIIEYFGDVKVMEAYERCPYCHAPIKWERGKHVCTTLTEEDANELRFYINNKVCEASIRRNNSLDRNTNGPVFQCENKLLQFFMRLRDEIDKGLSKN